MVISIGVKHRDCWHYKLSRALRATIIVRYTYMLPNRQLYGYQTILTPRVADLDNFLRTLPEIKKYSILSRSSDRAEVITWAEQGSIVENLLSMNCVFIGPTIIKDGIENWHIMAPSHEELRDAMASIERHADIAYIRNKDSDFAFDRTGLTEKQSKVLMMAIEMGYFDTPRLASIEDVAVKLGVAPSTAIEHLRKAEKKVLDNYVHPQ
mgnify:FL=1